MKKITYTNYHLAIADKLGWGDMIVQIALPAIDTIVSHFIATINLATGETLSFEDAAVTLLQTQNADSIFGMLMFLPGDQFRVSELRVEIETCMRLGFSHRDAIHECINNN